MNIETFLLCDAATDQFGKLNILGAFDAIYTKEMPMKYPACAIAVRIRFEKIEEGEHKIKICMIDADGNPAGPNFQGGLKVKLPEGVESNSTNFILNVHGLELKAFGKYRIDLAIDGQLQASLPFAVRQTPTRPKT